MTKKEIIEHWIKLSDNDLIFNQMTKDVTWDILQKTKKLQQWIKVKL